VSKRLPDGARPALQQRSREKRDRLIKAGITAFARDGYESARVVDLAKDAGISVGVFYQRFKDKRGFFMALETEDESGLQTAISWLRQAIALRRALLPGACQADVRHQPSYSISAQRSEPSAWDRRARVR